MKCFIIVFCLFLLACSKDDSSDPTPQKTRTELLIDKKWQKTAISGKLADGTIVPDGFTSLPSYAKDDYYLFKSNLKYELNDNIEMHPGQTDKVIASGSWALVSSDQYLTVERDSDGFETNVKITELTETQLKWESVIEETGTTVYETYKVIQ